MPSSPEIIETPLSEHHKIGMPYALEATKAIWALNSGSAVSMMAFSAQVAKIREDAATSLALALVIFGLGAFNATLLFGTSYLAQLSYGNGERKSAVSYHNLSYFLFLISSLAFLFGLFQVRSSLLVAFHQ